MKKWLHDRPWIWIVVFIAFLLAGSFATLIIAEKNRPVLIRPVESRNTSVHVGGI